MRLVIVMLAVFFPANASLAANPTVKDGATLQFAGVTYRLDGVDAPALDQICIDDHADPWTCGVEARDQLAKLIGARGVHCEDLGPDKIFSKRHAGRCTADGETTSLNQQMVRQGFALNAEPSVKGRFKDDETAARDGPKRPVARMLCRAAGVPAWQERRNAIGRGLPKRQGPRNPGTSCSRKTPPMPPGCNIKAKFAVRARVTGNLGIYHLQGCRSYAPLTKPDRWFCSEDDAQAAGFRRAYNCRAGGRRK